MPERDFKTGILQECSITKTGALSSGSLRLRDNRCPCTTNGGAEFSKFQHRTAGDKITISLGPHEPLLATCCSSQPQPVSQRNAWMTAAKSCTGAPFQNPDSSSQGDLLPGDRQSRHRTISVTKKPRSENTVWRQPIKKDIWPWRVSLLIKQTVYPFLRHRHRTFPSCASRRQPTIHHGTTRSWRVLQQPVEEVQVRPFRQRCHFINLLTAETGWCFWENRAVCDSAPSTNRGTMLTMGCDNSWQDIAHYTLHV